MNNRRLILAGNPNVGKSVIFSILAGKYVHVSNYPQTTIEVTRGNGRISGAEYEIIDTPGTNTLMPSSEDEQVTTDILLKEKTDVLLQVADSKNLSRALVLHTQLAELGIPMALCLNLADEADARGIRIDQEELSGKLGIPCASTVAVERRGHRELTAAIRSAKVPVPRVKYSENIEIAIEKISGILPPLNISARGAAVLLIEGNFVMRSFAESILDSEKFSRLDDILKQLASGSTKSASDIIRAFRRRYANDVMKSVFITSPASGRGSSERPALTSLASGIPVLLAVMAAVYWIVGYLGAQVMVDFMEETVFEAAVNPFAERILGSLLGPGIALDFFVGEYGLITMALTYAIALILPIIFTFFLVFSIMEDSGYLPRLSALLNNLFSKFGLSGKAVLPMVLGLGCTTMATMVTRILSTKRERVLATFLLALGIPCSAQLGVILGLSASISWKVTAVWFLSVASVMLITGFLASRMLKGGDAPEFIMELPPMRMPRIDNLTVKTFSRIKWYMKEVVPVFILGTAILFVLDRTGALHGLRVFSAPVVQNWLNLPAEAADAFIIGFFRRDFGVAGLYSLHERGMLDPLQVVTSLVTITLFVPCIANMLMIIKERGLKTGMAIVLFIFPFAFFIGGILRIALSAAGIF